MLGVGLRGMHASLAAAALCLSFVTPAAAVKLAVRATAALEARVTADGDAQVIRGTLRDDVGAPIAAAHVEVDVVLAGGAKPIELPVPRPCSASAGGHPPHAAPDAYVLDTDVQGVFCVRTSTFSQRGTLRVRFAGKDGIRPLSLEIPFDAEKPTPQLGWDPRPETLDLDLPQTKISVMASTRAGGGRPIEGLALVLSDEAAKVIATTRTDERGRATFDVLTRSLAGPGAGRLTVSPQEGSTGLPPLTAGVTRVARVGLVAAAPAEAIVPHDGHTFAVAAETSRGPAKSGAVEARIGQETVGVGTVHEGRAAVVTTFDVPTAGQLDIAFAFLPSGPELRAGEPLTLRVPVRPPSAWRRAPLFLLAAGLIAWLARGWRRPPRPVAGAKKTNDRAPLRLPDMVAQPERGARGFRGILLDAHEETPIAGAVVSIVARDFLGERRVAETTTAADGTFQLDTTWEAARTLVVDARLHARLEKPLPKPGKLALALVSRRRAVLERLLAFVRRGAGPAAPDVDPTPGQVARDADAQEKRPVATWARAVESATFGFAPVDAEVESRVVALEPPPPRAPALPLPDAPRRGR